MRNAKPKLGPFRFVGEREIGKFLPYRYGLEREQRALKQEEERQLLRRMAMSQATLTARREVLAKKLYRNEAISLEDWPGLALLTPDERTRILKDLRHILGFEKRECSCPNRKDGMHYRDCDQRVK